MEGFDFFSQWKVLKKKLGYRASQHYEKLLLSLKLYSNILLFPTRSRTFTSLFFNLG